MPWLYNGATEKRKDVLKVKKTLPRLLSILLVVCCLISISVPAFAASTVVVDSTHSVTVSKGGSTSMTYTLAAVWHSKGTSTPVYLSSFTSYWSASQPSGSYRPAFYAAAASEGLSTSRTYNPGSYTIGSSQKSGTYNINAVVGGNMGSWWVSEYSSPDSDQSGSTRGTIESGSISFSPTATSATIYAVWISSTPIS